VDILGDILAIFDFVIIPSFRVSLQILGSNYNRGINFVEKILQFSLMKLSKIVDQFEAMTCKLDLSG
jgi:hypothetical protein